MRSLLCCALFLLIGRASAEASTLFREATRDAGLPAGLSSEYTRIFDFNDDDYPDAFFVDTGGVPHAFLNERGVFREVPVAGLPGVPRRAHVKFFRGLYGDERVGALVIDSGLRPFWGDPVTREGHIDWYVVEFAGGTLKFTQLDPALFPPIAGSITDVHALDYNQDGKLDLVITNFYTLHPVHYSEEADGLHLFRGTGGGGGEYFVDVTSEEGLASPRGMPISSREAPVPSYGLSLCDIDGDGKLDILVPGYGRRWNKLYLTGSGRFEDRAHELGYDADLIGGADPRGGGNNYTAACADAANEGRISVFQGEITHHWAGPTSDLSAILWNFFPAPFLRFLDLPRPREFKNQGDISSVWGDLDLDGLQDLVVGDSSYPPETHLLIWHQRAGRQFEDWTDQLGGGFLSPLGPVLFDSDHGGALDLIAGSSSARALLGEEFHVKFFKNQADGHSRGHWMEVVLRSHDPGVPLVPYGSKVAVHLPSGVTLLRELVDGYGSWSQGPETLHFGLGELPAGVVELPVSVTWSNGATEKIVLPIDRLSRVMK